MLIFAGGVACINLLSVLLFGLIDSFRRWRAARPAARKRAARRSKFETQLLEKLIARIHANDKRPASSAAPKARPRRKLSVLAANMCRGMTAQAPPAPSPKQVGGAAFPPAAQQTYSAAASSTGAPSQVPEQLNGMAGGEGANPSSTLDSFKKRLADNNGALDASALPAAPERRKSLDRRLAEQTEQRRRASFSEDEINSVLLRVFGPTAAAKHKKTLAAAGITELMGLQVLTEPQLAIKLDLDGSDAELLYDAVSATLMNSQGTPPPSPPPSPPPAGTPSPPNTRLPLNTPPQASPWGWLGGLGAAATPTGMSTPTAQAPAPATPTSFFAALTGGVSSFVGSFSQSAELPDYEGPTGTVPDRMEAAMRLYGAIVIQKAAHRLRARVFARTRLDAATCLTSHVRGYRARRQLDYSLWAAETLQAALRGHATRVRMQNEVEAAVLIEKIARANMARTFQREQHTAATRIEAARRALAVRKDLRKRENAANRIAAHIRSRAVRQKVGEYKVEVAEYHARVALELKNLNGDGSVKPEPLPAGCLAGFCATARGMHTLLLICRQGKRPRDMDGMWLPDPSSPLTNAQALHVGWSVVSFDALVVGLAYAYSDSWSTPLATAPVVSRAIPIAAAGVVGILATFATRKIFRAANAVEFRQQYPKVPWRALGWLVCLSGLSLAPLGYFAIVTIDLQLHDRGNKGYRILQDIGGALGVGWLLLEPLAILVRLLWRRRGQKRARVGATSADPQKSKLFGGASDVPAGAPSSDDAAV